MRIVVIGRGNVGGGLAGLWSQAGHEVTALGQDGGDASDAEVVVVAVPPAQIADALGRVTAVQGKVTIDATNAPGERSGDFPSLAHQVKSLIGGPIAKAFNINFAAIYDEIGRQRVIPSNLYAAEEGAREITESLSRDAGFDPVRVGGLDRARLVEDHIGLVFAIAEQAGGPYFYRIGRPGDL